MYGQQVPGGRPQDFERVSRTVHVGGIGGLGETITENDVADFFGQQGEVTAVRISGRFCWVEFADVRAAHAALELDGTVTGGHHLRVSQSKSAIHSNGLKKRGEGGTPGMDGGGGGGGGMSMGYGGAPPIPQPLAVPGAYGMPGAPAPYAQQYGYAPQYAPNFGYGGAPSSGGFGYGQPAPGPQYPPSYGYAQQGPPQGYPPQGPPGGYAPQGYPPMPAGYGQPPPPGGGYGQQPPQGPPR